MSLILEALRKLEAEKQAPERGFLVVAAPSWPAAGPRSRLWLVATAVLVGGVAVGAAMWLRHPADARQPQPAPAAAPALAPRSSGSPEPSPLPTPMVHREETRVAPPTPVSRPRPVVAPRPSPDAPPSPPALVLEAISERDGRPIALVSDHLVREGDAFDGVTIVRIGEAEVEVEWRGERRILRF